MGFSKLDWPSGNPHGQGHRAGSDGYLDEEMCNLGVYKVQGLIALCSFPAKLQMHLSVLEYTDCPQI